jgi:hypothetical protein
MMACRFSANCCLRVILEHSVSFYILMLKRHSFMIQLFA